MFMKSSTRMGYAKERLTKLRYFSFRFNYDSFPSLEIKKVCDFFRFIALTPDKKKDLDIKSKSTGRGKGNKL